MTKEKKESTAPKVLNCEVEDFCNEKGIQRPAPLWDLEKIELIPEIGKTD